MPGFDVQGALKSGYSPAEVADYLGQQSKFDVAGARKSGYSDQEIIAHLTQPPAATTQPGPAPFPQPTSIQQVQQNATAAQSADIDKLKSLVRGFVNTLESGTDGSLPASIGQPGVTDAQARQMADQYHQQGLSALDQRLGL